MPRPIAEARFESCPACDASVVGVIDSRPHRFGRQRRRRCERCNHRWVTVEVPIELIYELERCGGGLDEIGGFVRAIEAIQAVRQKFVGMPRSRRDEKIKEWA